VKLGFFEFAVAVVLAAEDESAVSERGLLVGVVDDEFVEDLVRGALSGGNGAEEFWIKLRFLDVPLVDGGLASPLVSISDFLVVAGLSCPPALILDFFAAGPSRVFASLSDVFFDGEGVSSSRV
jgi:hypothetical protein